MRESTKRVSPLCQRMLEDIALRKLSAQTQAAYQPTATTTLRHCHAAGI